MLSKYIEEVRLLSYAFVMNSKYAWAVPTRNENALQIQIHFRRF